MFSKLFKVEETENQLDLAFAIPLDYGLLLENSEFLTSLKLSSNKRKQSIEADRDMYRYTMDLIDVIEKKIGKNK